MTQPVWITSPGTLGTIPEGVFYSTPLLAVSTDTVYYQVIAGQLPAGIQVNEAGILTGVPQAVATVQGVPLPVPSDVTSKFAVRSYTTINDLPAGAIKSLADRTFTITVIGQNDVVWVTPAGTIATYVDGSQISGLQVQYDNPDIFSAAVVTLISGILPPGLTISTSGVISGYIIPNIPSGLIPGFSRNGQAYDQYPFDFSTQSIDTNYQFTLKVANEVSTDLRTFNIFVYSLSEMVASTIQLRADNTFITADASPQRAPIITTPTGSIGTVRSDNFFAFQFTGIDFDYDQFKFIADPIPPVPGLTLDPNSGWIYGYLPYEGIISATYPFTVRAYKAEYPDVISNPYDYSLTITGPISSDVTWLTPTDLGIIYNGSTSTLYVEAINSARLPLQYQLVSGSDSDLPQGLELLSSGNIAGRVSFNTFALDSGATTFDATTNPHYNPYSNPVTGIHHATTFDMTHTFTVNAYSVNGLISVTNTFTITVVREYNEPYDNLYMQAMPPQDDRDLLASLLQSTLIFPPSLIYRADDPNFGVAHQVVYYHAYGLTAATLDDYVAALNINHYWKTLVLGSIEVAQALDEFGNVIYEVVYSKIIDDLVNNEGQSVGKEVTLAYPVTGQDSTEITTVYPNSLVDMRTQVIDSVGQISNILPRWMLSKQLNGQTLGFLPVWIIAYAQPGAGGQIAYNIQSQFGDQLNLVDFEVDRYELDNLLTKNWDRAAQEWIPTPPTLATFDIDYHYQLPVSFVFDGGTGYAVGDQILIDGSQVGGEDIVNDILLTVNTVDNFGTIESAFCSGVASIVIAGDFYYNIIGTNIIGTGVGATWDIEVVPGVATVFDGGSIEFVAPVDMYTNTQIYDKYLMFPKRNILE